MKTPRSLFLILLVLVFSGCNEDLPLAPELTATGMAVGEGGDAAVPGPDKGDGRYRWREVAYLEHPAADGESFGNDVGLARGRVMVGAPGASTIDRRGAFVFEGARYNWNLEDSFGSNSAFYSYPGVSVALSSEHAIMASNVLENSSSYGSVQTFLRWDQFWLTDDRLAPDEDYVGNCFGFDMDLDDDLLVVGAINHVYMGAAYLYRYRADGDWSQEQLLMADDAGTQAVFGWSVAVTGRDGFERVAVGAPGDAAGSGAVYIFKKSSAGYWWQAQKLTSSGGNRFGKSVALYGKALVVGEPARNQVHVFKYLGGEYCPEAILSPSDPASAGFGEDVDVSSRRVIVGAPDGSQEAIYIYDRSGFSEAAKFTPSRTPEDRFGLSVAIMDRRAVVGTEGCGAYIYELFLGPDDPFDLP